MKPGHKTTEFMLSVATTAVAVVLLAMGKIDATAFVAISGASTGGYSLSRGIAKTNSSEGDSAP